MGTYRSNLVTHKTSSRSAARLLVLVFVAISVVIVLGIIAAAGTHTNGQPGSFTTRQGQLLSQVDTTTGVPRSGRDPSSQQQTSLASVASQPAGNGKRVAKPAKDVAGNRKPVNPESVLPNTKKTGVLASGCLADYGAPGEQCLPAATSKNKQEACRAIGLLFKKAPEVRGKDRLGLDHNKDGLISNREC